MSLNRITIAMSAIEEPSGNCVRGVQRLGGNKPETAMTKGTEPLTCVTSARFTKLEINYIMYGVYKKKQ
jgi:hypothetical protein